MEKAKIVCMGFKPGTAERKAQTDPLSYDGFLKYTLLF